MRRRSIDVIGVREQSQVAQPRPELLLRDGVGVGDGRSPYITPLWGVTTRHDGLEWIGKICSQNELYVFGVELRDEWSRTP